MSEGEAKTRDDHKNWKNITEFMEDRCKNKHIDSSENQSSKVVSKYWKKNRLN